MARWPELRSLVEIGLLAAVMLRVCLGGGVGSGVVLAALGAVGVSAVTLLPVLGAVGVSAVMLLPILGAVGVSVVVLLSVALVGVRVGGLAVSSGLADDDRGLTCCCGMCGAGVAARSPPEV